MSDNVWDIAFAKKIAFAPRNCTLSNPLLFPPRNVTWVFPKTGDVITTGTTNQALLSVRANSRQPSSLHDIGDDTFVCT